MLGLGVGAKGSVCSLERRESLIHPWLGLGVGAMGFVCSLEQRESLIHPWLGLGVGAMDLHWIKADHSVGLQEYQDSHFASGSGSNQKILQSAPHPQFQGPKSRIVKMICKLRIMTKIRTKMIINK